MAVKSKVLVADVTIISMLGENRHLMSMFLLDMILYRYMQG